MSGDEKSSISYCSSDLCLQTGIAFLPLLLLLLVNRNILEQLIARRAVKMNTCAVMRFFK